MMTKWVGLIAVSLLLAACSTLPTHAPQLKPTSVPIVRTRVYPEVELTQKLLYDILLGEIAGERGDVGVSTAHLSAAAAATGDPRLARRAVEIALFGRRYPQAEKAAHIWVRAEPKSLSAHEAYAQALLGAGHWRRAEAELKTVLDLSSPDHLDDNYLAIAGLLVRQPVGSHVDSLMRSLVALHPHSAHAYFSLSQLEVQRGDVPAGEKAIDHALVLKPAWEDAAVFKGHILMLEGRAEEGAHFYRSFLYTYPQATELRLSYARYLVNMKDWEEALVQFQHVAADVPDDPQVSYAVGLLAMQTRHYTQASRYLKHTLALQPGNHRVEIDLGEVAEKQKDNSRARYWYERGAHGDSRFQGELHIALLFAREGRLVEAEAKLKSLKPSGKVDKVQLALSEDEVLTKQRRYRTALRRLDKILTVFPGDTNLLYARSLVELKLNMLAPHEHDLRKILKEDPQNVEALNALGYTLTNHSTNYSEALDLIQRALKLRPGDPYIMDSMGWAYYRLGHLKKATKYLRSALASRPDAEIAGHLGEVLWRRGDHGEAETIWKRALKRDPNNRVLKRIVGQFMH